MRDLWHGYRVEVRRKSATSWAWTLIVDDVVQAVALETIRYADHAMGQAKIWMWNNRDKFPKLPY